MTAASAPSVVPADAPVLARAGQSLHLLPGRGIWWPERSALLVADVHLGKGAAWRHLGVPVPEGTDAGTLARLGALLDATGARRLVVLGDLLHDPRALQPRTVDAVAGWRAARPALEIVLVRGNHDARAGDPPAALRIDTVTEPLVMGPFALCHEPSAPPAGADCVLAGHLHPAVRLRGRGDAMRLPCFWFGREQGVLPAFGEFTGGLTVRPDPTDRVFAVAGDRVIEVPPALRG